MFQIGFKREKQLILDKRIKREMCFQVYLRARKRLTCCMTSMDKIDRGFLEKLLDYGFGLCPCWWKTVEK